MPRCMAGGSSPRAVRYTMRVFCSPTGSAPAPRASPRGARSLARRAASVAASSRCPRRRRAAAGDRVAVGHHELAAEARRAAEHRADRPRVTLTACTRSMSSTRPSMRMRTSLRPQSQGDGPHAARGRPSGSAAGARPRGAGGSRRARPEASSSVVWSVSAASAPLSGSTSSSIAQPPVVRCSPWRRLALAGHRRPHVAHAEVSATEAPQVASICARTAPRPAPGSPAVTMWRRPSDARVEARLAGAAREVRAERQRAVDRRECPGAG